MRTQKRRRRFTTNSADSNVPNPYYDDWTETTNYIWDGDKLLGEDKLTQLRKHGAVTATFTTSMRYIYDATSIQGVRVKPNNSTNYINHIYLKDTQGNIVGSVNEQGGTSKGSYTAYGEGGFSLISSWHVGISSPIGWQGQYRDSETGFYYINGRYYDPSIAQFLQPCSPDELDPSVIGGLDRYNLATATASNHTIEPYHELSIHPSYIENLQQTTGFWYWVKLILHVKARVWNATAGKAIEKISNWWSNLHWGWKVGIGVALFVAAVVINVATGGGAAVGSMIIKAGFTVGLSAVVGGGISALTGGSFNEGAREGAINGTFFAGVFAFGSAAMAAAKKLGVKRAAQLAKNPKCFAKGTLVLTDKGNKPIEDIEVGDLVWAYDEETGESGFKPVVRLFRNGTASKGTPSNTDDIGVGVNHFYLVGCLECISFLRFSQSPFPRKWGFAFLGLG
jgi:RHS repeat-associated protein